MSSSTCSLLLTKQIKSLRSLLLSPCRCSSTLPHRVVDRHRKSKLAHDRETEEEKSVAVSAPRDYKYVYPEFLPDPTWHRRDRIREKLEHTDMYKRRDVIDVPEFYVGSIMAVSASDPLAPTKKSRFVGLCIHRGGHGLRAQFTLRNVLDGQGLEITYELYNPTLQRIDVLKLERRLDDELYYLRDAPLEYSTVPFDFEAVAHPPGAPVPVNSIKVPLGPRPWHCRWERFNLQGLEPLGLPQKFYDRAEEVAKPWEQYDLMKKHRSEINADESGEILGRVRENLDRIALRKRRRRAGKSTEGV